MLKVFDPRMVIILKFKMDVTVAWLYLPRRLAALQLRRQQAYVGRSAPDRKRHPAASTKANLGPPARDLQCGFTRAGQDVDVPSRYRGECDGTPHRPFSGGGPARRRWQHVARNALSAVGWPTF